MTQDIRKRTKVTGRVTPVRPQPGRPANHGTAPQVHRRPATRVQARPTPARGGTRNRKRDDAPRGFGALPMMAILIFGVVAGFWIGLAFQQAGFTVGKTEVPLQTYRPPPNSSFTF